MTMEVKGAWASNALWPDSSTTRKSNTDYDALARRAAADDAKTSAPIGLDTVVKKATPSGFTQDDFALVTRLGPNGMAPQTLEQLTGLPTLEREPWHGVDRAASNPYGNILGSLRRAALRRDAAAPAVPEPDTPPSAAEQAQTTPASTTAVSTAIAAYTATAASAPPPSGGTPSSGGSGSSGETTTGQTNTGDTTSVGESTAGETTTGGTTASGGATSSGGTSSPSHPAWRDLIFGRH